MRKYDELPDVLKVEDIMAYLRISRSMAYKLVHSKEFEIIRIGKMIMIPKRALINWLEKNAQ